MWVCDLAPSRPWSCRYCPISLLRGHQHRLVWVIRRFGDDTAFWIATPPTRRSVRCIAICLPTTAPSRCPAGSGSAHGLGPKSIWPKRYQQINGFARMRSESRMRIIMFLLCLQRGAGQAIPRARKTNGRTGGSRTPRSRGASIGTSISRLSLSRFEARFNLGSHFDGVAALDRWLITKLRPLHSLTELHAGFELSDFPFRVDDDFAANCPPRGLPQGCGLNGRTLNQKSALFIRSN